MSRLSIKQARTKHIRDSAPSKQRNSMQEPYPPEAAQSKSFVEQSKKPDTSGNLGKYLYPAKNGNGNGNGKKK